MHPEVIVEGLRYPEGLFWSAQDRCIYFVEWNGDTILTLREGRAEVLFHTAAGDGPCGLGQDATGHLWATHYSARRVVRLDNQGKPDLAIEAYHGAPFRGPNQLVFDAHGGMYFTDSGDYEDDWRSGRPAGAVYYLSPRHDLLRVASGICFANGLMLSRDGRTLIVNEHRQNRVLAFAVLPDGRLGSQQVLARLDSECLLPPEECFELGPDGICLHPDGNFWVTHYGGAKVIQLDMAGRVLAAVRLPRGRRPTNVVHHPEENVLYVTESEVGLLYRIPLETPAQ